jgi:NADH-quinone oxidoreductase subunit C
MSQLVLDKLKTKLGDAVVETHNAFGDDTAVVTAQVWHEACELLRKDASLDFDLFVDLCAVDYPTREPRFEVVLHLYSVGRRHRVRLKTRIGNEDGDEGVELPTITDLWAGANWFEREVFDMSGVVFRGHPDMRRILMYPEFVGHPLRKDYPATRTQPLVEYRTEAEAGLIIDKLAPFGADEGMSFGRKLWTRPAEEAAPVDRDLD